MGSTGPFRLRSLGSWCRSRVPSSQSAQEVAFAISGQLGTEVLLTHVVNRVGQLPRIFARRSTIETDDPAMAAARSMMGAAVERATDAGLE